MYKGLAIDQHALFAAFCFSARQPLGCIGKAFIAQSTW